MKIKQMGIDEAFERFKRGMEVGILQPVIPEPKGLGDYELMTLKKLLDGCVFFRIMPEKEEIKDKQAEKAGSNPHDQEKEKTDTLSSNPDSTDTAISKPGNKLKLDMGKMKALRAAGWTYKKIAEEMGISEGSAFKYLNMEVEK